MSILYKFKNLIIILFFDFINYLKYGKGTPKKYQRLWVDPKEISFSTKFFIPSETKVLLSGADIDQKEFLETRDKFISGGDWDLKKTSLYDCSIIYRAKEHYVNKRSWKDVGEIDWLANRINELGNQDGCRCNLDIKNRLSSLDNLFNSIQSKGALLTRKKINKFNFREKGGIGVGIDRNGKIIWIADGAHRLVISKILNLKLIPVCLLVVHERAVINKKIKEVHREC